MADDKSTILPQPLTSGGEESNPQAAAQKYGGTYWCGACNSMHTPNAPCPPPRLCGPSPRSEQEPTPKDGLQVREGDWVENAALCVKAVIECEGRRLDDENMELIRGAIRRFAPKAEAGKAQKGWKVLRKGNPIEKGDEYLKAEIWEVVPTWVEGREWNEARFLPMRRKAEPATRSEEGEG